jgi:hypothetical protein
VPHHIKIQNPAKQMLTNSSGWCQKQDTGLEGTVTDELFQVFPIEGQKFLFRLSEYLLKIKYTALWYNTRMIKDNIIFFKQHRATMGKNCR